MFKKHSGSPLKSREAITWRTIRTAGPLKGKDHYVLRHTGPFFFLCQDSCQSSMFDVAAVSRSHPTRGP